MEGTRPADESPSLPRYRARGDLAPPAITVTSPGPTIRLGPRDVLTGRLVFDGDLRVQGTVEGEATVSGELHIEDQGTVKAKLQARSLSVRGTLEGEVTARERLVVAGSGVVSGTVRTARLVVEDGALLNGTITMERPTANGRPAGEA